MRQRINNALITERMRALSLSERQTLARIDIPTAAFREARLTGWLPGHTNLRQISGLADALGITVVELLNTHDASDHYAPLSHGSVDEDAALLIPLLVSGTGLVDTGRLATALEWPRPRLLAAVDEIPTALKSTGMKLVRTGAAIAVEPVNRPSPGLLRRIGNAQTAHRALNLTQARLLRRIVNGEHVTEKATSNADRVALGALKNKGCIEIGDHARWRSTAHLALALGEDLNK